MDLRRCFANLPKESDVRSDGRDGHGRKPAAGFESGNAKQRRGGNRPDDGQRTGESSSGALGKDSGEVVGWTYVPSPIKAGGNTETEWGGRECWGDSDDTWVPSDLLLDGSGEF